MTINVSSVVVTDTRVGTRPLRRLVRNPLAIVSSVIVVVLVVVAVIGPWIVPFSPDHVELLLTNAPPFTSKYLLGGDLSGRDVLTRLILGTRDAMIAAVTLTVVALVVGLVFGLIAGYFGRLFDSVANWIFGILLAVPGVVLLIGLYTLLSASTFVALGVLGVLTSTSIFYLVRNLTRSVRDELYVDAARVSGVSNFRIIARHVLLVVKGPVIIIASFLAAGAITVSAGLQFLGLGQPNVPSWGGMLNDAFNNYFIAPWQLIWPSVVIGLTIVSFVLLGSAIRDAFEGSQERVSSRTRRRLLGHAVRGPEIKTGPRLPDPASVSSPLLVIEDLQIAYVAGSQLKNVVSGVSLTVQAGEIVGLVGESGSGKSQTVFATLGILPETAIITKGSVRLSGQELLGLSERELARHRVDGLAYIPQEPMSNLDPVFRVGSQLVEGIRAQSDLSVTDARQLALSMLARVGIANPVKTFRSYPHEISGGMAQRVLIAGAIACKPKLLIADEPTTALDVTVQAEILDLLRDLQSDYGMGILIVTHNFGVVADLCDRVAVMRDGQIVERGNVTEIFTTPQHDYTKMLLASILDDAEPREPLGTIRETTHA